MQPRFPRLALPDFFGCRLVADGQGVAFVSQQGGFAMMLHGRAVHLLRMRFFLYVCLCRFLALIISRGRLGLGNCSPDGRQACNRICRLRRIEYYKVQRLLSALLILLVYYLLYCGLEQTVQLRLCCTIHRRVCHRCAVGTHGAAAIYLRLCCRRFPRNPAADD